MKSFLVALAIVATSTVSLVAGVKIGREPGPTDYSYGERLQEQVTLDDIRVLLSVSDDKCKSGIMSSCFDAEIYVELYEEMDRYGEIGVAQLEMWGKSTELRLTPTEEERKKYLNRTNQ